MTRNDSDGERTVHGRQIGERPPDTDADAEQERPIGDGKTGEALTVEEAKRVARERIADPSLSKPEKTPDPERYPDDEPVVGDGATGEAVTVTEAKRRARQRTGESRETVTDAAVGKDVLDADGKLVGMVSTVEEGTPFIDPDPGLTNRLKAQMNWGGHGDETYPIDPDQIQEITEDHIKMKEL